MQAARPGRPVAHHDTVVSRTVLSVVRILIASYFLATASGVTRWRVGSAFWGVVAGTIARGVQGVRAPRAAVRR